MTATAKKDKFSRFKLEEEDDEPEKKDCPWVCWHCKNCKCQCKCKTPEIRK